jgi:hypothetical protein
VVPGSDWGGGCKSSSIHEQREGANGRYLIFM